MQTVELEDDAVAIAETIAREQGKTVGEYISGLLREWLNDQAEVDPPWVIQVPGGAPAIDNDRLNRLLDEDDADYVARCQHTRESAG
jgi:hypothetical protein